MDIFCQAKQKLRKAIISETDHFLLLHDGFPLAEGHLFIIPRHHVPCFLDLEKQYRHEFNKLVKLTYQFLSKHYQKPVVFEHGIIAQTIQHAHLHFVPTSVSIEQQILQVAKPLAIKKKPYLFFEVNRVKRYYVVHRTIDPGFLHTTYAIALGRPTDIQKRSDKTKEWRESVRKKWKMWLNQS